MYQHSRIPYLSGCEVLKLRPCKLGCYEQTHPGELTLLPIVEESLPYTPQPTPTLSLFSHCGRPAVERGSRVLDQLPDPAQRMVDDYHAGLLQDSTFIENDPIIPVRRRFLEYYL